MTKFRHFTLHLVPNAPISHDLSNNVWSAAVVSALTHISRRRRGKGCICVETCRFSSCRGSAEERTPPHPLPAPYFLQHKQDSFFQSFGLAASSASEGLCDLNHSEVSNFLASSGNDKPPRPDLEVSEKRPKRLILGSSPGLRIIMNEQISTK